MTTTKMIQLKRIAEEASVSIATVSRVLAKKQQVSEKTRDRVMKVAQKLNYRPNRLVHALQSGKTQTVGVMIDPRSEYHASVLAGIEETLLASDYLPIVVTGRELSDAFQGPTNELDLIHRLVEQRVDGIILCPIEDETPEAVFAEARKHQLPVICVDRQMPNTQADFVGTDDLTGGRMAAEYLLKLGHKCVGHLAGPRYARTGRLRREGFEQVIGQSDVIYHVQENKVFNGALEQAQALLQSSPRPTAIFAASDILATYVYKAAYYMGLSIPLDLSVIGFADLRLAAMLAPSLTTLRQDSMSVGQHAAAMMLESISGKRKSVRPEYLQLKPQIIERESTCAIEQ
jgi:DNA-binding LacI/PurR family transcriptional regulator